MNPFPLTLRAPSTHAASRALAAAVVTLLASHPALSDEQDMVREVNDKLAASLSCLQAEAALHDDRITTADVIARVAVSSCWDQIRSYWTALHAGFPPLTGDRWKEAREGAERTATRLILRERVRLRDGR